MKVSLAFLRAFWHAAVILTPVWLTLAAIITGLGVLIARIERLPLTDGLYFAWVTGITIGYGDIAPQQPMARLLSIVTAIVGVILTGMLVAIAVQALKVAIQTAPELESLRDELARRMKD